VLLSFLDETATNIEKLNDLRSAVSYRTNVPVWWQTGPRYLHSTGQLWKGGKNNGHFIIITGPYAEDLFNQHFAINFSDAHIAQAIGDYLALVSSQRRVLYAHCNDIDLACKELIGIIS
jgi:transaldolase/glucose-6-phosphate isomerase